MKLKRPCQYLKTLNAQLIVGFVLRKDCVYFASAAVRIKPRTRTRSVAFLCPRIQISFSR